LGEELFFTVGGQHIPFGASPQDVWSELGRPCGIHHMQVAMLQGLLWGEKDFSSSLCLNFLHISLPHGKLILSTHRPNGYSFCL
ncbi:hypothetical protein Gohar_026451, partial [Gossypium harknessii]|nr:hypothetical protein [Gossypium harknessii]